MIDSPEKNKDIFAKLYPITAREALTYGQQLSLSWELKNRTAVGDKLLAFGKLDHQIGADVRKLLDHLYRTVAVEFLPGDFPTSQHEQFWGIDHGGRGFLVETYDHQFHLVSWREIPEDYQDAISMYTSSPVSDPDTPRFRLDAAYYAEGEFGKKIVQQKHEEILLARSKHDTAKN